MRYSNPILALSLLLALTSGGQAMTTYTEQWMSGDTVYATASTDSDFEPEVASATLVIYGPSGTSASAGWGDWYYACVQTSLQLTTGGEHYAYSTHYTQSIAAIAMAVPFQVVWPVWTNFQFVSKANNVCVFTQNCPGAGGGTTRLCSHLDMTQTWVGGALGEYAWCGTTHNYLKLKHAFAVRFAISPNWFCFTEISKTLSSTPGECTSGQ